MTKRSSAMHVESLLVLCACAAVLFYIVRRVTLIRRLRNIALFMQLNAARWLTAEEIVEGSQEKKRYVVQALMLLDECSHLIHRLRDDVALVEGYKNSMQRLPFHHEHVDYFTFRFVHRNGKPKLAFGVSLKDWLPIAPLPA